MNLEQISEDELHAVCLQRLWAEPAIQEGSKTSAEFPGAPLFKWHWCHWVHCRMQSQHGHLLSLLSSVHLQHGHLPTCSFKCHQKMLSVNRCGWAGDVQVAGTISTQSTNKPVTGIYLRPEFKKLPGLHHFLPRLACWIQAAEHYYSSPINQHLHF